MPISVYQLGSAEVLAANKSGLNFGRFTPQYSILPNYSHLIVPPRNEEKFRGNVNTVEQVADLMKNIVQTSSYQVSDLAKHLFTGNAAQDAFNVWHFIKTNIRYAYDRPKKEDLREPARAWADRFLGCDCDCYSIFISAVLKEMGYSDFQFWIVSFYDKQTGKPGDFQHVFVVFNTGTEKIVLDPVLNSFNALPPNIAHIMKIQVMPGTGIGALPQFSYYGSNGTEISGLGESDQVNYKWRCKDGKPECAAYYGDTYFNSAAATNCRGGAPRDCGQAHVRPGFPSQLYTYNPAIPSAVMVLRPGTSGLSGEVLEGLYLGEIQAASIVGSVGQMMSTYGAMIPGPVGTIVSAVGSVAAGIGAALTKNFVTPAEVQKVGEQAVAKCQELFANLSKFDMDQLIKVNTGLSAIWQGYNAMIGQLKQNTDGYNAEGTKVYMQYAEAIKGYWNNLDKLVRDAGAENERLYKVFADAVKAWRAADTASTVDAVALAYRDYTTFNKGKANPFISANLILDGSAPLAIKEGTLARGKVYGTFDETKLLPALQTLWNKVKTAAPPPNVVVPPTPPVLDTTTPPTQQVPTAEEIAVTGRGDKETKSKNTGAKIVGGAAASLLLLKALAVF